LQTSDGKAAGKLMARRCDLSPDFSALNFLALNSFPAQYTSTITAACSADFTTSSNLRSFVSD
jgi:hypothetical protein